MTGLQKSVRNSPADFFLPILMSSIRRQAPIDVIQLPSELHEVQKGSKLDSAQERYRNRTLPDAQSLPKEIKLIEGKNGATIYVVGTAHLSNNSNYQVLNLIEKVQPDRVMVELCPERQGIMYANEQMLMDRDEFTYEDFKRTVEQKGVGAALVSFALMGATGSAKEQLHALPGAEFRVARKECEKVPNCKIVLGDRRLSVTFKRLTEAMSTWEKVRFVLDMFKESFSITQDEVEDAKNEDVLSKLMNEMKEQFPSAARVIIDERDRYLTAMLQATARQPQKVPKSISQSGTVPPVVVAVVGIGHQKGILKYFDEDITSEEMSKLNEAPDDVRGSMGSVLAIFGAGSLVLGFVCFKCAKSVIKFLCKSSRNYGDELKSIKIA